MNAPNQLSFLPDDYLVRKAQHRTNLICATLFVVMIGAIAVTFSTAERSLRKAETRHTAIDQQYIEAARPIADMNKMNDRQRVLTRQAELAASLIDRTPRSYMLADITNRLPPTVSLTDFEMIRKKRASTAVDTDKTAMARKKKAKGAKTGPALPPAPDQYDVTIRLSGIASSDADVATFLVNLKASPLYVEENLISSAQFDRGGGDLRRFSMEMMLDPTSDIRPAANARPTTPLTQVQQ